MDVLKFNPQERQELYSIVAAILHLGNVNFTADGEGSKVANPDSLGIAANLLGVPAAQLSNGMTVRHLSIR